MKDDTDMRPLIAGNWKMNGLKAQLGEIAKVVALARQTPDVDIVICPPATLIAAAAEAASGAIAVGAQDCDDKANGPYTGAISAQMVKDAGAAYVILGHSERRQGYGETDALVAAKVHAAQGAGLQAMVCIGETDAQRRDGQAYAVCADQLMASLPPDTESHTLVVAYEPLWAIGREEGATPKDIQDMHAHIRATIRRRFGPAGAVVRILYGGSVDATNVAGILAVPDVGGVLVGRASLEADDFDAIITQAAAVALTG